MSFAAHVFLPSRCAAEVPRVLQSGSRMKNTLPERRDLSRRDAVPAPRKANDFPQQRPLKRLEHPAPLLLPDPRVCAETVTDVRFPSRSPLHSPLRRRVRPCPTSARPKPASISPPPPLKLRPPGCFACRRKIRRQNARTSPTGQKTPGAFSVFSASPTPKHRPHICIRRAKLCKTRLPAGTIAAACTARQRARPSSDACSGLNVN